MGSRLIYASAVSGMPMKAAFDVACLSQSRTGTARVARGLLGALTGVESVEVVEVGDGEYRASADRTRNA